MSGRKRQSNGRKSSGKRSLYCADKKLIPRLKQCLADSGIDHSLEGVVTRLQSLYPEYGRKKIAPFKSQVKRIYSAIVEDDEMTSLETFEKDYLKKQRVADRLSAEASEFEITTDSEIELVEVTNNMMNGLVTDIYSQVQTSETDPQGTDAAAAMTKESPVKGSDEHYNVPVIASSNDKNELKRKHPLGDESAGPRRKKKRKTKELDIEQDTIEALKNKLINDVSILYPKTRFSDLGGCDSVLKDVCEVLVQFRHPEVFNHLGVAPPQGFLLHGPPGCGKTLLAHAIAGELNWPMIYLTSTEIISGVSGESEEKLRNLFQKAKENAPCVFFIDEIDAISPRRDTAHREMERRVVTQLLSCMDDLSRTISTTTRQVLVIGATNRVESIDPCLRRSGRFDREITLGIPNEQARNEILHVLLKRMRIDGGVDISQISHLTPGYVGADLSTLAREAAMSAVNRALLRGDGQQPVEKDTTTTLDEIRSKLSDEFVFEPKDLECVTVTSQDFKVALTRVTPSAKKEGFATVPDTTWDDVGALEAIREELTMTILAPVRFPDQFARLGLRQPPGILLAGPPGCGKTLLAKAIANESGINFISIKGPELLNMYVGESERAVRQVFQRARNSAPCVIFFDEIDALCPKRSTVTETSSSARVVNQLLTEMDGLETRNKQVFLMGATNRPDIIDPAVLRPGRLDKILYVGLPTVDDRLSILTTVTKNGTTPQLGADVELPLIASEESTKGFSGADLAALVREAACIALKEFMALSFAAVCDRTSSLTSTSGCVVVCKRHFDKALQKVQPSVPEKASLYRQSASNAYIQ